MQAVVQAVVQVVSQAVARMAGIFLQVVSQMHMQVRTLQYTYLWQIVSSQG